MNKDVKTLAERVAALGHKLEVGYWVYASGVVTKQKNAVNEPIVGIIVAKNKDKNTEIGNRALMMTLPVVRKAWANREVELGVCNDIDGQTNTKEVLKKAEELGIDVPAFKYCAEFSCEGISVGEAYMPSKQELLNASKNADTINETCFELGVARFIGIYLSSTEHNKERAWQVRIEKSAPQVYAKTFGGDFVRAFVAL